VPTIGASLFATLAGFLVDALLESWASIYVRIMVGLIVSIVTFYWARLKLLELRGDA